MTPSPQLDETIHVECRAEHAYPQRPVALHRLGERLEVDAVLREWRTPEGKHYHVVLRGGGELILFYQEASHRWQVRER